jgi:hypothetical protein
MKNVTLTPERAASIIFKNAIWDDSNPNNYEQTHLTVSYSKGVLKGEIICMNEYGGKWACNVYFRCEIPKSFEPSYLGWNNKMTTISL